MASLGKTIRLKRVIEPVHGTSLIFAIDHGMTSPRFLAGLEDTPQRVRQAVEGGANVIMLSRGFAPRAVDQFRPDTSLALLLTASAAGAPSPRVTPIASVEEALRLGADAVVVFVALTGDSEPAMISFLGQIGEACDRLAMPLIAEAEYPTTYQTVEALADQYGSEYLLRNCRLCAELGADVVKTNWSGDVESFTRIVEATAAPVVLAGGSRIGDAELLGRMDLAMSVGAIGCSVGRNIFQHANPTAITGALARVIRDRWSGERALAELEAAVGATA